MMKKIMQRILGVAACMLVLLPISGNAAAYTAGGETSVDGSVDGSFVDTWYNDAAVETLTESVTKGRPIYRISSLDHSYSFLVPPSAGALFYVNAWSSDGTADAFQFSYSRNGGPFVDMFAIRSADRGGQYYYYLPSGSSAEYQIRVTDTDKTPGERVADQLFINEMVILIETDPNLQPPAAPSGLIPVSVDGSSVQVAWQDNSPNELGFEVYRSPDGVAWSLVAVNGPNTASYTDTDVTFLSTYYYSVRAFNVGGPSAYAGPLRVDTPNGIGLSASTAKAGGTVDVNLSWSGGSTAIVNIYRDGGLIATVANSGTYTDPTGLRTGSVQYQVCDFNRVCSAVVQVDF